MYFLVVFCVLSTVSTLPTPEKIHTAVKEPLFSPKDLHPQPNLEIHNIKIKCLKNDPSHSLPEICSELLHKDFVDWNVIKENSEKNVKRDLTELKAEEPEDPSKEPSPSDEPEEQKISNVIEESVTNKPETTTTKTDSGEKNSIEDFSEEKETFEPLEPEDNKKPSILSIFSPILHFFDNIFSFWNPKSKSNFNNPRSFYLIEIETD